MLLSVAELQPALHELFNDTARELAESTGFCQRERLLSGPAFAQSLVFCLLHNPDASLDDFADFASRHLGIDVTPSAFSERFGPAAARLMLELFLESFDRSFSSLRRRLLPVLRRFDGVYLRDATTVSLPCRQGRGGGGAPAAVKLVLEVEVTAGRFTEVSVLPGAANDRTAEVSAKPLPKGALLLEDMGFLCGARLLSYFKQGVYVLTRIPAWAALFRKRPGRLERLNLVGWLRRAKGCCLERRVRLFHKEKLAVRLLAVRLPEKEAEARRERVLQEAKKRGRPVSQKKLDLCEWNILVTNAPAALISVHDAWEIRRVRWQIELVFKLFKSEGGIERTRAEKPGRVLAELFAKLLAMVVQQWLLLASGYAMLTHSARKAARRVRRVAGEVLRALGSVEALAAELKRLAAVLHRHCRLGRRHRRPSTYDRLYALDAEFRSLHQAV